MARSARGPHLGSMSNRTALHRLTLVVLGLATVAPVRAQNGAADGEWRAYAADGGSTKYSALSQIHPGNVENLQIAWRWKADNFGRNPEFNYRVTPIMVDGVLYTTAGYRRTVVAIDAASGETLWMYRMDEGERGDHAPRQSSGRGVSTSQSRKGAIEQQTRALSLEWRPLLAQSKM